MSAAKDGIIKRMEWLRGIYHYPNRMLGRRLEKHELPENTDILVIAAHPDDDILGAGVTLYRHRLAGKQITVVFTTNGTGESWKLGTAVSFLIAETRINEAIRALDTIGIPHNRIFSLGFPDRGTHRYLKEMSDDLLFLMKRLKPQRIYVHSIEGGHVDHDMTSYVTQTLCALHAYEELYEWAEYNRIFRIGSPDIDFPPHPSADGDSKERLVLTDEERDLKKRMLVCHKSQGVAEHAAQGEVFRKAACCALESQLTQFCKLDKKRLQAAIAKYKRLQHRS